VFIAVAFCKKSGFDLISNDFELSLERGTIIIFVCGLDFYQTEPNALKAIYSLALRYENCKLLIQEQNSKSIFHPKLYYFRTGDERTVLIGSANFTKGGFKSNFELSFIDTYKLNSKNDNAVQSLISEIQNN
jgi:HKD family nuclease